MAVLEEFQFELDEYVFGHHRPIFVDQDGFDPGDESIIDQDQTNPLTGARVMGRDVVAAGTWTFAMHVDGEDPTTALEEVAKLKAIWRNGADGYREGRVVKPLRYNIAGRTRVVYGRPRRFSFKPNNRLLGGYLPPLATFDRADDLHYADEINTLDMALAPDVSGGFEWPATWPLTFDRDPGFVPPWEILVGGDAPTLPIITFFGPVTDPSITIGDFTMGLAGSIGEGGSVEIDTRPWAQTITRAGNAGSARLTRDVRLTRAALRPGAYSAVYRGTDATGESSCRVVWRDAWHSL